MNWALLLQIGAAQAHPFDAELYGHKTLVQLDADRVEVHYAAEVPTRTVLEDMRTFLGDVEAPGPAENEAFVARNTSALETGLTLEVDGRRVPWKRLGVEGDNGVGDYRYVTFRVALAAALPEGASALRLYNNNFPDLPAVYNTELRVHHDLEVTASSLYDVAEGEIVRNREGEWRVEPRYRELTVAFEEVGGLERAVESGYRRIAGGTESAWVPGSTRLAGLHRDPLTDFVKGEMNAGVIVSGLLLAVVLGALHAFSPGHGKTLVAAYLLGGRQTVWHALWLGIIVTVTHTAGVLALGLVALGLSESTDPATFLPWMELASGLIVLAVGARLLQTRFAALRPTRQGNDHGDHDHSHDHEHDHRGGHSHEHAHVHEHPPGGHEHSHDHVMSAEDEAAHARAHADQLAAAGTDWKSIVGLGMSGGLVPCPSALVVLLTAVSFHRVGFGLAMVVAFSLGLGAVLVAIGAAVVLLGSRLAGSRRRTSWSLRVLPVASAVVVTLLGVGITIKGVQSVIGG